ncbi:MAG: sigma-70 family RNA polymerase sigma factor [Thermoguttaceae bacterium]|nr:sigma-70 family RNA polymerase sigma factor [Thermoguttaceae bacterium]
MARKRQPPPSFATTHWSVVLAAGAGDDTAAREALAALCRSYWYPLYAYARRRGHPPQDAEDLIQSFFVRFLEHNWVARADQQRGRFRTFLLTALDRFLANEWDKVRAIKRGGHLRQVALEMDDAESRFSREPADPCTPEQQFERQWALTVLDRTLAGLREEYAGRGQAATFDALKPTLLGSREAQPYASLAEDLGVTQGSVKVMVSRLRERYRQRLLEEIAHTVASPDEVDSELRHLFRVLSQ